MDGNRVDGGVHYYRPTTSIQDLRQEGGCICGIFDTELSRAQGDVFDMVGMNSTRLVATCLHDQPRGKEALGYLDWARGSKVDSQRADHLNLQLADLQVLQ